MKARLYQLSRSLPALISVGHVRTRRENRDFPEAIKEKKPVLIFRQSQSGLSVTFYRDYRIIARDVAIHCKFACSRYISARTNAPPSQSPASNYSKSR